MNKVIILGHLGDDPKTHNFDNGGSITRVPVATTESWKDKQTGEKKSRTEWHTLIFRNKTGENVEKFFKKGDKILVEGKISSQKYTDKDGNERTAFNIECSNFHFVGSSSGNSNNTQQQAQAPQQQPNNYQEDDDDLPF
jgi:single-strand DNA-binding protein